MGSPIYYQTHVFQEENISKLFNFEDLETVLQKAARWGAFAVELPMGWDCANEFDSDNTNCSSYDSRSSDLRPFRAALKANNTKYTSVLI